MKKDKKHFKEALFEGLLELILTLVCFGLGALIVALCGFGEKIADMEFETLVLLGIAVPLVIFAVVYALVQRLKGRRGHLEGETKKEGEHEDGR